MTETTYLVAKYVRDVVRQEPRNIGLMLCDRGRWLTRFVGEAPLGELDKRKFRHRFRSPETYLEWHRFWNDAVVDGVQDTASGETIPPDDPAFARALCDTGGVNFSLELGAPLAIPASVGGGEALLSHLFAQFVDTEEEEHRQDENWSQKMKSVIHTYGLADDPCFRQSYEVPVQVRQVEETLVFPYAYVNGQTRLYKKMPIEGRTWGSEALQRAVNDVLWSFTRVKEKHDDYVRIALMYTTPEHRTTDIAGTARKLVEQEAEAVVDLGVDEQTEAEFALLAAS